MRGGGGTDRLGAADYRARLDAGCTRYFGIVAGLPERRRDEALPVAQLQTIATTAARPDLAAVRALTPPAELASTHAALAALLADASPPAAGNARAAANARARAVETAYDRLDAPVCSHLAERSVATLTGR